MVSRKLENDSDGCCFIDSGVVAYTAGTLPSTADGVVVIAEGVAA